MNKGKDFAVFVPIIEKDGEKHVLFEIRTQKLKDHKGEICFPGGLREEGETPEQCAVRETCEELGIQPSDISAELSLGAENNYSGRMLYSFAGTISGKTQEDFSLSENEVADVFTVPLSFLLEAEPFVQTLDIRPVIPPDFRFDKFGIDENYPWRTGHMDVPVYEYDGHKIWGFTARVVMRFVSALKEKSV